MNDEKVVNELKKAAEVLGMELSAIEEKYNEIREQHGIEDGSIAMSLFRQWFSGMKRVADSGEEPEQKTGSDNHTVLGYVVAVEDLRDFEQYNRDQLKASIIRDENTTFNAGKFAKVTQTENGYEISRIHDNELSTVSKGSDWEIPESVMDVNGNLCIPLDDRKDLPWGPNKDYGMPKPLNNYQRGVHFIGSLNGGEVKYWKIGLKDDKAKDWNVDALRAVYLDVYASPEHLDSGNLYNVDLETVVYNDELENPQPMNDNFQTLIAENMRGFICPLINLENYHMNNKNRPAKERLVIVDGNVSNMYMNPNSNGNRTLYISDLNADFDYDNPSGATPCWVPEHVELDFGIGSQILVIGRSSQSMNQETGIMRPCSINVFGVIVLNRMGSPTVAQDSGETNVDWF